tara:strand:- start:541 stop:960 length:420 start_codon:yes stop_codon:yes gene_type:complete
MLFAKADRAAVFEGRSLANCWVLVLLLLTAGCRSLGKDLVAEGHVAIVQEVAGELSIALRAVSGEEVRVFGSLRTRWFGRRSVVIQLKDSDGKVLAAQSIWLYPHRHRRLGSEQSHFSVSMAADSRCVATITLLPELDK